MNSRQKEVLKTQLSDEQKQLNWLKQVYKKASEDCANKIAELSSRTDLENIQSIVYQKYYQEALKNQIDGVLNQLHSDSFMGISDYLSKCYETGYVGAIYDIAGQGIPLIMPIDGKQVVQALQTDSALSESLYKKLGEDTNYLKKSIKAQLSRGIVNGSSWNEIADKIANGMNSPFNRAKNNAMRIARTEGHRIQMQSQMDACDKAKSKGADVVKQWDATLDGNTRDSHKIVDGEIRKLDEKFSNGLMFPGDAHGSAAEVCNCRCSLLQRAKWGLDESELQTLKDRADFFELDKSKNFEDFKEKYLKITPEDVMLKVKELVSPVKSDDENYTKLIEGLQRMGVDYKAVTNHIKTLTDDEIIGAIAGGDRTEGSCASLGLVYIGQKQGWNVLDFRDGTSRIFFSKSNTLDTLSKMNGVVATRYGDVAGKSSCTLANNFLKTCEVGKEYLLAVGRHVSIVRKTADGKLQYLELQIANNSGWTKFNGNPRYTLTHRFGCSSASGHGERYDFMINITDSKFDTDEFKSLLGFINTSENEQKKGVGGYAK